LAIVNAGNERGWRCRNSLQKVASLAGVLWLGKEGKAMSSIEIYVKRLVLWIFLAGAAASSVGSAAAQEPEKPRKDDTDLKGKVVQITAKGMNAKGTQGWSSLFTDVRIRRVGNQDFFVGKVEDPGDGSSILAGLTLWVAAERVEQIVEFKDLEQARKKWACDSTDTSAKAHSAGKAAENDVWDVNCRSMRFPLSVEAPRRDAIKKLLFYVSTDCGRSWKKVAEAEPSAKSFRFDAPGDGVYWFAVQVLMKDGTEEPKTADLSPSMKVHIDTANPAEPKTPDADRSSRRVVAAN
jgi:hypothetical protein